MGEMSYVHTVRLAFILRTAQGAYSYRSFLGLGRGGVLGPRCYGCGRCIDVCPPGIIKAQKYKRSPQVIRRLMKTVEAVEIHTKVRWGWERGVGTVLSTTVV